MVADVELQPLKGFKRQNVMNAVAQKIQGTPFVVKTYQLITDTANNEIVDWNENGDSFVIKKPVEFSSELLPKFFKHNNLCSFIRQLNTYGFNKQEAKQWEFKHELFLKNHPEYLKNITRRKSKKRDSEKEDVDYETSSNRVELSPAVHFGDNESQHEAFQNFQRDFVPEAAYDDNNKHVRTVSFEPMMGTPGFYSSLENSDSSSPLSTVDHMGFDVKVGGMTQSNLILQVQTLLEKQNKMQDALVKILSELVESKREQKNLEKKVDFLSSEVNRLVLGNQQQEKKTNVLEELQASFGAMSNPKFPHNQNLDFSIQNLDQNLLQPINNSIQFQNAEDEAWAVLTNDLGVDHLDPNMLKMVYENHQ